MISKVLERLYRLKWGALDGLGALVISPTRELALQIFEELRKVGGRHEMSAGLLIGGKNVQEEAVRVAGINILVATPGRLLQQLSGVEALLEGRAPRATAVQLLLRLGTRVSLPEAQVCRLMPTCGLTAEAQQMSQ